MVHIGNDWDAILADEWEKEYYLRLRHTLRQEYATYRVYPSMHDIFNALKYTSYADTKVVIIGQDPYHGAGQAHGLCFSVQPGVTPPPSLKNIFKELSADVGKPEPPTGDLTAWAKQGVLLLNTVLTVREGHPTSHKDIGWERVTDRIIMELDKKETPVVFLLWGANAGAKGALITNPSHLVLKCAHPSPLSAYNGFFGCRHFSKTNKFLSECGLSEIDWRL